MVKVQVNNEKKFDFGIFSNEKKKVEQAYVSLDKQGRIYMNADAQKLFGIEKGKPVDVQVGYKDGTLFMIKNDSPYADPNAKPFRFSGERAYASAKTLIESLKIAPTGEAKSEKYLLNEEDFKEFEGVYAFTKEAADNGQVTIDEVIEGNAAEEVAATEEKKPKAPRKNPKKDKEEATA